MLAKVHDYPGLLFVGATLLPLLSFLLIFLRSGIWGALRPYRDSSPFCGTLYNLFGGDTPGRGPAYLALGAIALAFVFSLTGFMWYATEHHALVAQHGLQPGLKDGHGPAGHDAHGHAAIKPGATLPDMEKEGDEDEHADAAAEAAFEASQHAHQVHLRKWSGSWEWLRLKPAGLSDPDKGTVLSIGYYIDSLSALMFVMVTFVASLIHLFSMGYMSEELGRQVEDHQVHGEHGGHFSRRGRFGRFFMFLSLFCFSMLNLVLADNLFQVFISWELVGICSYLLIGFYYERQSAANASNKAFITNRIGDAGFILGLLIVWTSIGTFNFQDIFRQVRAPLSDSHGTKLELAGQIVRANPVESKPGILRTQPDGAEVVLYPRNPPGHFHPVDRDDTVNVDPNWQAERPTRPRYSSMAYWLLTAAGLGIFLGCVGKSAQFPLQVWLPDAMEGPTPVSALIHAATMVAAGVYLVGRCFPLFTPEALLTIAYTGGITLFVAASIAVVMTDIKKVLAYSTVSQLGYMMLALGVGGWEAGLFHLMTHAFFKAQLFLGSGSVIYGCHHEQDMTKMGGLRHKMPITAYTMLLSVLAIAGTPLFSGWHSKDAILAAAYGFVSVHRDHLLLFLLPLVTAGITTFYMFRMWFMTFAGEPRDRHVYDHAHETPWTMTTPLVVLGILAVVSSWGWPPWNATESWMGHQIKLAQPVSVRADFGHVDDHGGHHTESPVGTAKETKVNARQLAHEGHDLAGFLALGLVILGVIFAALLYVYRVLDPVEAREQFPGVYAFLTHKWYFDELYSAIVVRPALVVAHWFKWFDLNVIDGLIHGVAGVTVWTSKENGRFDNGIIDGLANLLGDTVHAVGSGLRTVQTGYLRSYVLFLVLAAAGLFVVLSYFVALAAG